MNFVDMVSKGKVVRTFDLVSLVSLLQNFGLLYHLSMDTVNVLGHKSARAIKFSEVLLKSKGVQVRVVRMLRVNLLLHIVISFPYNFRVLLKVVNSHQLPSVISTLVPSINLSSFVSKLRLI